jgi:hypothetical protein
MLIHVTRTANVAGLRREVHVELACLPSEHRERLAAVVSQLDLGELQRSSPIRGTGADHFQYEITLSDAGQTWHFVVDESRLGGDLADLIDLLLNG